MSACDLSVIIYPAYITFTCCHVPRLFNSCFSSVPFLILAAIELDRRLTPSHPAVLYLVAYELSVSHHVHH